MESSKERLLDIVEREYAEFKKDMLRKTKEEILDDYVIVYFYNEIRDFFCGSELSDEQYNVLINDGEKGGLFEGLWCEYIGSDYSSIASYDDIKDIVSDYIYSFENREEM